MVWSKSAGIAGIQCMSELPNGRLVVGGSDTSVRVLDGVTGREIMACRRHTNWVFAAVSLGVLNAGSFATGSQDLTIRVGGG